MPDSPPIGVIHLGLGAFHRAHQAWFTHRLNISGVADPVGIWAFTAQRSYNVYALAAQGYRYSVVARSNEEDSAETVTSIVRATDGGDSAAWREAFASSATTLTTTDTESYYRAGPGGGLDPETPAVVGDIARLRDGSGSAISAGGRIVEGLRARRQADGGPMTVVSCDRGRSNGDILRGAVIGIAERVDSGLAEWITESISFFSSVSDRIIPAYQSADDEVARRIAGWSDAMPVITEPYAGWTYQGPGGADCPRWDLAGARRVEDLRPFEDSYYWIRGAAHLALARFGLMHGHEVVADAFADPSCAAVVDALWDEVTPLVPDSAGYRAQMVERLSNGRLRYPLGQRLAHEERKLRECIVDACDARRAMGLPIGSAAAAVLAAWVRASGDDSGPDHVRARLHTGLGVSDDELVEAVTAALRTL